MASVSAPPFISSAVLSSSAVSANDTPSSDITSPDVPVLDVLGTIGDDLGQYTPLVKILYALGSKWMQKSRLEKISKMTRTELHVAGKLLGDDNTKAALKRVDVYKDLKSMFSKLETRGSALDKCVQTLTTFDIFGKYKIYVLLLSWQGDVSRHTVEVVSKSDRAKIGLDVVTGALLAVSPAASPQLPPSEASGLSSPSELTLIEGVFIQCRDTVDDSDKCSQHSATSSMHGNPWLNFCRPGESSTEAGRVSPSIEHSKKKRVDKGKQRAR